MRRVDVVTVAMCLSECVCVDLSVCLSVFVHRAVFVVFQLGEVCQASREAEGEAVWEDCFDFVCATPPQSFSASLYNRTRHAPFARVAVVCDQEIHCVCLSGCVCLCMQPRRGVSWHDSVCPD